MEAIGIKTIKTVLTAILLSVMLLPMSSQEVIPFEAKQPEAFNPAPPSTSNTEVATFNSSGPNRATPPGGGSALGIAAPVRDVFWLLPVLAILYGLIRANRVGKISLTGYMNRVKMNNE